MRISDEEFEHEVEAAIDSLPDRFKRALDNVGIAVADEPNERERATMQRQCDELLGLYEGVPITRRFTGYSGVMPDIITHIQGPARARLRHARRPAPADSQDSAA